jgi:hypothetical protein
MPSFFGVPSFNAVWKLGMAWNRNFLSNLVEAFYARYNFFIMITYLIVNSSYYYFVAFIICDVHTAIVTIHVTTLATTHYLC